MPPSARLTRLLAGVRPDRSSLRKDALAAVPTAISSVPDGMAAGALAGVSPVHGLYACIVGPIAGGFSTSTRLMVVTTTSAAALAAGSAVADIGPAERPGALVLLTLLAGAVMIVAGLLRLGRYTRFVSHSVMIGFLTGVAVNIVLGQLPILTGVDASGAINLTKAIDVLRHPGRIDAASLAIGLSALIVLVGLARTRVAVVRSVIALVVPASAVLLFGLDSVARVDDGGAIPGGIPLPEMPNLDALSLSVVGGALAVAAIVLVQGAGVAESARNPNGRTDANQDFVAQGAGNVAAGLFKGMPVGGSVGQTALNVASGARTRWSVILAGVWMLAIIVACSTIVGKVAVPTLAAILIVAAVSSLRLPEVVTIWRTGPNSQIAILAAFVATLLMPVAAAVGIGVVLSLLLQLNQEAIDLAVVELVTDGAGRRLERPAPAVPASHAVTVLDVYGSLFYAGSRTLQARLPDPSGSDQAVVVLRLRGRTSFGATFYSVVADYADRLEQRGGRLYLSGVDPRIAARLAERAEAPPTGAAHLVPATDALGESTMRAVDDARHWLVRRSAGGDGPAFTNERTTE